ncbi:hypothetical protein B0A50_01149 [Salinomyces thailandicus]|uniref:HIT-type domain-containing protein n=1 Tax=Salinomyces thailandicus TaxID=706561 RepID=A0A4U0UBS8_9PEZI|nr:hypothetical protein B0A50_01149 [Salinomyces thailandica]
MALPCDICHAPTSKYKCPTCTLRSCSLACYKSHTPTHTTSEAAASSSKPPSQSQPRDRPGTTNRIPKIDFKGFENDPELKRLLSRYPLLRLQLQATYALTLEPSPDEARSWSWQPLPGEAVPTAKSSYQHFRDEVWGRERGRGGGGLKEGDDDVLAGGA